MTNHDHYRSRKKNYERNFAFWLALLPNCFAQRCNFSRTCRGFWRLFLNGSSMNATTCIHLPCVFGKDADLVLSYHALWFSMDVKFVQKIFDYTKRFRKLLSNGHVGSPATTKFFRRFYSNNKSQKPTSCEKRKSTQRSVERRIWYLESCKIFFYF